MFAIVHKWSSTALLAAATLSTGSSWVMAAGAAPGNAAAQPVVPAQEAGDSRRHQASNYVLMPSQSPDQQRLTSNGCWIRLYEDKNFTGGAVTLTGPQAMATMLGPFGINWKNRVKSLEIGQTAVLTVYDNESFQQQILRFEPGTSIAELRKRTGYFDDFASLKITCRT